MPLGPRPQTQGSAHFKNEQRKQLAVDGKIARMRARAASLSAPEIARHERAVDAKIAALEARRDLGRSWLHVDMDVSARWGRLGLHGAQRRQTVWCRAWGTAAQPASA